MIYKLGMQFNIYLPSPPSTGKPQEFLHPTGPSLLAQVDYKTLALSSIPDGNRLIDPVHGINPYGISEEDFARLLPPGYYARLITHARSR